MKTGFFNFRTQKAILANELNDNANPMMFVNAENQNVIGVASDLQTETNYTQLAERLPINILVVDDALVNQLVLSRQLEKLGYTCTVVHNGQEAYDAVMKSNFELVLMDLYMPVMTGAEATQLIKDSLEDEAPLIIGVTSTIDEQELNEGTAAGIDDYLKKPYRTDDLLTILEKWESELRIRIKN